MLAELMGVVAIGRCVDRLFIILPVVAMESCCLKLQQPFTQSRILAYSCSKPNPYSFSLPQIVVTSLYRRPAVGQVVVRLS
jgi:hypothetical protein